jgi:hypothetical protein
MKVTNPGDRVYLPCIDAYVDHRQEVEVDETNGLSLVEQGWISARSKAAKKVARKRAAKKAEPLPVQSQQAEPDPDPVPEPDPAAADKES